MLSNESLAQFSNHLSKLKLTKMLFQIIITILKNFNTSRDIYDGLIVVFAKCLVVPKAILVNCPSSATG